MTNGMRLAILASQIPMLALVTEDRHPWFRYGMTAVIVIFMAVIVLDSMGRQKPR